MSTEEKKEENQHPVTGARVAGWWRKARFLIPIYDAIKVCIIIGGVVYGVGLTIENRVAEVLANPKRTTILEKNDSSQFAKFDSTAHKHDGYFTTIFRHIDTGRVHSPVNFIYTGQ